MNLKKQYLFTQKLQALYKSGKPIVESISYATQKEPNRALRKIFEEIHQQLKEGKNLHQAIEPYEEIFGTTYTRLIAVGETSGKLDQILEYLLQWQKSTMDTNKKIIGASIYPIILVLVYLFVIFIIFFVVFPAISDFMISYNMKPPFLLEATAQIKTFFLQPVNCLIIPISGVLSVLIVYIYLNTGYLDNIRGKLILLVPGFGRLNKLSNLLRYFFTLKICYNAGLSAYESLSLASSNINNTFIYNNIAQVEDFVKTGDNIYSAISKTNLIDFELMDLIRTGEESGTLNESYNSIVELLDEQINTTIAIMIALIKPLGILFGLFSIILVYLGVFMIMSNVFCTLKKIFH